MKKAYPKELIEMAPDKSRVAIVQALWHAEHTDKMVAACSELLSEAGVIEVVRVTVPGCYEIPLLAKKLAKSGKFSAIVVFGAIVRGDTDHYHLILETCIRELGKVMYDFEVPIINEILPVHKLEHLIERSTGAGNKGIEAAQATIGMMQAIANLKVSSVSAATGRAGS